MTPRGIEILIKKASVDDEFKDVLLAERSHSARRIGLDLNPAEAEMLDTFPAEQLGKIIAETEVEPNLQPVFRGYSAIVMLAVLGTAVAGCIPAPTGSRPDDPADEPPTNEYESNSLTGSDMDEEEELNMETGIRPDLPYLDEEAEEEAAVDNTEEEAILEEHKPNVKGGARPDVPDEGE